MIRRPRAPRRSVSLGVLLAAAFIAISAVPAAAADFPAKDSRYHNFTEMSADIHAVEAAHPDIVDVFSLGKSYQGRDIWGAKISDNVDTDEPEAIRQILEAQPQVRAGTDGTLAWLEPNGTVGHEIGTWSIEGKRVLFETNSQERATRGRAWLEALAAERVRYRATALETIEQTMNELRRHRPKHAALEHDEPPVEEAGAVRELYDRHYQSWLDRPLLALANRTPRAAARSRLWRRKIVDMLKAFENISERAAQHGRPPYDFRWIWRELGLDRPGSA